MFNQHTPPQQNYSPGHGFTQPGLQQQQAQVSSNYPATFIPSFQPPPLQNNKELPMDSNSQPQGFFPFPSPPPSIPPCSIQTQPIMKFQPPPVQQPSPPPIQSTQMQPIMELQPPPVQQPSPPSMPLYNGQTQPLMKFQPPPAHQPSSPIQQPSSESPLIERLKGLKALTDEEDQLSPDEKEYLWKHIVYTQPKTTRDCLETFGLEVMSQLKTNDLKEANKGIKLKIFKCVINQLKIKIPDNYSDFKIYWSFFALLNLFEGETLNEVREAYKNYLDVFLSTECMPLEYLINDPFTITNKIHDLIYKRMTQSKAYEIWDTEPYVTSAIKITTALHAEGLRRLYGSKHRPLGVFREKWGLFPEGCPDVSAVDVECFPPHKEVPIGYLYMPTIIGKMIISVDLKKSGFEIMRLYDKDIVCGGSSWKEFISIVMRDDPAMKTLDSVGIDKFRGIRMRSLGKMYHEKSRALQSHVLRMFVRAMVYYCVRYPQIDIGCIESVFKFSCDELIIICSSATDPDVWRNALRIVDGAMNILGVVKSISRMELIHLRAIDYTPRMIRHFEEFLKETGAKPGQPPKDFTAFKHVITEEDEKWTEPHVSRDTFNKIFIREKYWGSDDDPSRTYEMLKTHTFSLKSLPKQVYVEGALEVVKQLYPEWYAHH